MLRKVRSIFLFVLICVLPAASAACTDKSGGDYYYVSNGVTLSKSQAEDFERAFELSSNRLQEAIDVPLDESAYTGIEKELAEDPFPEARVWSSDINSASNTIDNASGELAARSKVLNDSLDEEVAGGE